LEAKEALCRSHAGEHTRERHATFGAATALLLKLRALGDITPCGHDVKRPGAWH